jgi:hypothetical protein
LSKNSTKKRAAIKKYTKSDGGRRNNPETEENQRRTELGFDLLDGRALVTGAAAENEYDATEDARDDLMFWYYCEKYLDQPGIQLDDPISYTSSWSTTE